MRSAMTLGALFLVSCTRPIERPLVPLLRYTDDAPTVRSPTEDAPFRTLAPALGVEAPTPGLSVEPFALDSGLHGFVVRRRGFPMIAARLTIDTSGLEVGDVGGRRASLLSGVFLSPPEGVLQTSAGCGAVGCSLSSRGTSGQLGEVLGRIADLVTRGDGADVLYAQRLHDLAPVELQSARDPARSFARIASALLFGQQHRYGQAAPGDPPTLDELKALRRRAFDPRRSTLFVVGDVSLDEVVAEATRRLGTWDSSTPSAVSAPDPPAQLSSPRIAAFDAPSKVQIMGGIVARGPAPTDRDFPAFRVLAEMLGGTPASEAFQQVREEMTAAYSVGSWITTYPEVSVMGLGGSFERDKAINGMARLLESMRAAREESPSPETLQQGKRAALSAWRRAMATDEGIAAVLGSGALDGIPVQATLDFPERVRAVTSADVQAAARRYLAVGALRVVLTGDSEYLVEAQALHFGTLTRVDGFGRSL